MVCPVQAHTKHAGGVLPMVVPGQGPMGRGQGDSVVWDIAWAAVDDDKNGVRSVSRRDREPVF